MLPLMPMPATAPRVSFRSKRGRREKRSQNEVTADGRVDLIRLIRRSLLLGSTSYHRVEELLDELRDPVALL
jgi:hypothetical protein